VETQQNLTLQAILAEDKRASQSWVQRAFGWLSPVKLPRPPTWDGMERPIKDSTVQNFDGFQFELQRNITNSFGAYHALSFGGAQEPFSYVYGITLAETQNEQTETGKDASLALARVNFKDYSVSGTIVYGISPRFTVRLQPQMSSQPHSSGVVLEADYKGADHTASVKFIQPQYLWEVSYTQALTKTWRAGSQVVYAHKQGISGMQLMLQRQTSKSTFTAMANLLAPSLQLHFSQKPDYGWFADSDFQVEELGTYEVPDPSKPNPQAFSTPDARPFFKFNKDNFNLISELMIFRNPQNGNVEINSRYGFKVNFFTGMFMTNIDIHGAIGARYEERFSETASVQFSAEADQKKQAYKVGLGFQFVS